MTDQAPVIALAALIGALVIPQLFRRTFDPFAPVWLFLAGYTQIYVVQAISRRDYALRVRGVELTTAANVRALSALAWFLVVYFSGLAKPIAARLPRPPTRWSTTAVVGLAPFLIAWGLISSGFVLAAGRDDEPMSAEGSLFRQFPLMMLIAAILLIVTGRQPDRPRPALTAAGITVAGLYVIIWMFNGKRSHSLFGVATAVCAYYTPRLRRPSLPVLGVTTFVCALVVSLALGWRGNGKYEQSFAGFAQFAREFDLSDILINLSVKPRYEPLNPYLDSRETEEYGGFLLMLDTVPMKSDYDYGASYLRLYSSFIPRLVWPGKPYYGREAWINAWIAGSEFPRDYTFTGPAIGILGACQLNGGAVGTVVVIAVVALMLRIAYDYYRFHALSPWAQAWWALTFYNAWMLTANDDPFVWFYYNYGHTTVAPLAFFWIINKLGERQAA